MEESDNSDVIRFEKFLIVMTDVLANKKYTFIDELLFILKLSIKFGILDIDQ